MTIVMLGVCRDGMVAKNGEWKNPQTGQVHTGVGYTPCKECGGKGCPKPTPAETAASED